MKKENKKLAQEIRAKERAAAARRAKMKKVIPAVIIGAAAVVLVVGIIVTSGSGSNADAGTENVKAVATSSLVGTTSLEEVSSSSEPKSDIETPSESGVLQANKDLVVKEGDLVDIDYVGKIDGVAFDGGDTKGEGARLRIGSGQYIPGFEDQIIGHKPGETFDVVVTFPEDYGAAELAGKEAVFTTTLNGIYKE